MQFVLLKLLPFFSLREDYRVTYFSILKYITFTSIKHRQIILLILYNVSEDTMKIGWAITKAAWVCTECERQGLYFALLMPPAAYC